MELKDYINYSGGAKGADQFWQQTLKEYGIGKQVNYRPDDLYTFDASTREEIEMAYAKAAKDLGRKELPFNWNERVSMNFSGGLVRRDYLQAKSAEAIFAVSDIILPGEKGKPTKQDIRYPNRMSKPIVDGGTGYAVQMGINLNKRVFVFHQKTNSDSKVKEGWYIWENNKFSPVDIPVLTKRFAGIGTRELNDRGREAIQNVVQKTRLVHNLSIAQQQTSSNSLADEIKRVAERHGHQVSQDFKEPPQRSSDKGEISGTLNLF